MARNFFGLRGAAFAVASIVAALGGIGNADAQSIPTLFDGAGFITDVSGCSAQDGFITPVPTTFVYRPKISAGDFAEGLELNFIGKAAALIVSTSSSGKLAGSSTFESTGISYFATPYSNGSKTGTSKLVVTPKTITGATEFVTITGTIKNMTGNPSCTLTISAALTKRP